MLSGSLDELALATAMAVTYLVVIRFLDLNEREPLWSVSLLFALGGAAATVVRLTVDSAILELDPRSALVQEGATFVAIAVGLGILSAVGRLRGWSDVVGPLDGIIYGAAAGLGYATGEALGRWLAVSPAAAALLPVSRWELFGSAALAGLAHGTFGALLGAGFAGGSASGRAASRVALPLLGLAAAVLIHAVHHELAFGNALGGTAAVVRGWIALLLPMVALACVSVHTLVVERRTIAAELDAEARTGAVTPAELALLLNFPRRQLAYLGAVLTLRLGTLWCLSTLHNRQVMLALAKRRAADASAGARRDAIDREVDVLRLRIAEARAAMGGGIEAPGASRS